MAQNLFYTHGRGTKNIDPWHSDGEMWKYSSNPPESEMDDFYSRVAAVYRAINFTADTLANMPFAIVNEDGDEIDTSQEYENNVGFLPYPRQLFRLLVQSYLIKNRAYAFQETKGRTITLLRYIAPSTITTKTDNVSGELLGFRRTVNGRPTEYLIRNDFCNVVYWFNLNWKQELLPDDNSPFLAMMNAAGIGYYADKYIKDFFERGGIKPTILTFDGVLDPTSMERVESVWTKVIRGYYKFLGKVFNGKFTPTVIGEGIAELKDQTVYDNALRNIAIAVGMPQDALLQNADSYATAQVHKSTWFSDTLVPLSQALAEPLNEQVFKRLGYRFEFRPETADPDMEEERQRISAAEVLFNILDKGGREDADKAAIEAFGIDMPQWFNWEKKPKADPVIPPGQPFDEGNGQAPQIQPPTAQADDGQAQKTAETVSNTSLSVPALFEMQNWQDLAIRKWKRGHSLKFDWTPKDIDPETAANIKAKLDAATTKEDIKAAFDVIPVIETVTPVPQYDDEIKLLAEALNNAAAAVQAQQSAEARENFTPPLQPVATNMTAHASIMDNTKGTQQEIQGDTDNG